MPETMHWVVAAARCTAPNAPPPDLATLPNLNLLLRRLDAGAHISCADDCRAVPLELHLARLHGLLQEPGHIPWAAFETRTLGQACAWVHPCHWQVSVQDIVMDDPRHLVLDEAGARSLIAAMAPFFAEDGITLEYHTPHAWLARGEVFRTLPTVSPQRVAGQSVVDWTPKGGSPAEATLQRLHNEMQMLLYTLPYNDQRSAAGLAPVNAFWLSGAGALDNLPDAPPKLQLDTRLQAHVDDPAAHARAWRELDADLCARALTDLNYGTPIHLTLCGAHAAQTWAPPSDSAWQRFMRKIRRSGNTHGLDAL